MKASTIPATATTTTKTTTTEDYIKHKKLEEEERARKERRARRRERRRLRNALALEGATSEHTTRTVSPSLMNNSSDLFDASMRSYSTVGSMVSAVTLSPGVLNNRMTTRRTSYRHHRPIGNWKTIQADPCGLTPTKKSKVMN